MKFARRHRLLTALVTAAAVLFAQAAVAMHACAISVPAEMALPCHEEPSPTPTPLCHAHCQTDKQTVDQVKPLVPGEVVAPLLAVVDVAILTLPPHAVRFQPALAHAASPPIPILFQRLRN